MSRLRLERGAWYVLKMDGRLYVFQFWGDDTDDRSVPKRMRDSSRLRVDSNDIRGYGVSGPHTYAEIRQWKKEQQA